MCKEMKWAKGEVESSMKMLDSDGDGLVRWLLPNTLQSATGS